MQPEEREKRPRQKRRERREEEGREEERKMRQERNEPNPGPAITLVTEFSIPPPLPIQMEIPPPIWVRQRFRHFFCRLLAWQNISSIFLRYLSCSLIGNLHIL
jgi:hypothetical protein